MVDRTEWVVPPDVRNVTEWWSHQTYGMLDAYISVGRYAWYRMLLWPTCPGRRLEPQPHHLRRERRDAVRRPRGRRGPQGPDRAGDAVLHEPDVRRLALLVRLAPADGDQHPVAVGRVGDVGPVEGADLAPPHPGHEEEPCDHGVEAAALAGDGVGLDARGRGAAGGGRWRGRRPGPPPRTAGERPLPAFLGAMIPSSC